jgi:hypothetical protein
MGLFFIGLSTCLVIVAISDYYYHDVIKEIPVVNTVSDVINIAYHSIKDYFYPGGVNNGVSTTGDSNTGTLPSKISSDNISTTMRNLSNINTSNLRSSPISRSSSGGSDVTITMSTVRSATPTISNLAVGTPAYGHAARVHVYTYVCMYVILHIYTFVYTWTRSANCRRGNTYNTPCSRKRRRTKS